MKKFILFSCLFLVFVMLASWDNPHDCVNAGLPVFSSSDGCIEQSDSDQKEKSVYTCPMHSDVVQYKPGKCPKCGMALTAKVDRKEVYICPMHSEVSQNKPGKCPECGMNLVVKAPAKKEDSPKK